MPKKILQKESPVLRKIAESIPISEVTSQKIQRVIAEMKAALASQEDGVAIAAPQIGYPLRIFVVSGKVAVLQKKSKEPVSNMVYINPVILKLSKEKTSVEEGCLSVRYLYGKVERASKTTIEALDENGKKFRKGASGLMAQIFQHETDHLNGILFVDKAKYLEEIKPEKQQVAASS